MVGVIIALSAAVVVLAGSGHNIWKRWMDGWLAVSKVFQLYSDNARIIMKGFFHNSALFMVEKNFFSSGIQTWTIGLAGTSF